MTFGKAQYIAVVGAGIAGIAGIAGAACADALGRAGHAVHVFDKSRGPGGRLAARRLEWIDRHGQACTTRLDHGAVALTARSEAFRLCPREVFPQPCCSTRPRPRSFR